MDAKTFYQTTDMEAVEAVCQAAGTNLAYFRQIAYGHRKASPHLALKLEQASGGVMRRHDLRPDIYPMEVAAQGLSSSAQL